MFIKIPPLNIEEANYWSLDDALIYRTNDESLQILIPKGFKTDLASVPRVFRRIVNVNGNSRLAAIVHDYLYSVKGVLVDELGEEKARLSREACDKIFYDAMAEMKVLWITRRVMHLAVRVGGWLYWNF